MFSIGFFTVTMGLENSAAQESIKIGVFGPMSGAAAAYGVSLQQGVELAVKETNAAGGVLGKKIELIFGDDAGKPDEAVTVVNRFISKDNVLMVIGSTSSPCSFSASQVTQRNSVPLLSRREQPLESPCWEPLDFPLDRPGYESGERPRRFHPSKVPESEEVCVSVRQR